MNTPASPNGLSLEAAFRRWSDHTELERLDELDRRIRTEPEPSERQMLRTQHEELREALELEFYGKLQRGELIASGVAYPRGHHPTREVLSPELWHLDYFMGQIIGQPEFEQSQFFDDRGKLLFERVLVGEPHVPVPGARRLVVRPGERIAIIDGEARALPEQPLKLLRLLAEAARAGPAFVPNGAIDEHLWGDSLSKVLRPTRDVVRDLRDGFAAKGSPEAELRQLIEGRTNQGYRLALAPDEIAIEA